MSKYETVVVFSLKAGEEKAKSLVEKFKALIESNGTMEAVDEWGQRKLAYPINYETDGYYVLYTYEADVAFPAELERVLNITDGVLRHLVVAR
jgi:small subunit ribosomal protein S6